MSIVRTSRVETSTGAGFDVSELEDVNKKQIVTAWVNFDGTTTPPTIRDSFNVSSVDKNGTGDYTINFSNAMDNTNFINVTGTHSFDHGNVTRVVTDYGTESTGTEEKTVNSIRVVRGSTSAIELKDGRDIYVLIVGGKA